MLVDTKKANLHQLVDQKRDFILIGNFFNWNFYPNCDAIFLRMCSTNCTYSDSIWVKLVPQNIMYSLKFGEPMVYWVKMSNVYIRLFIKHENGVVSIKIQWDPSYLPCTMILCVN